MDSSKGIKMIRSDQEWGELLVRELPNDSKDGEMADVF